MSTLYLTEQRTKVSITGKRLKVHADKELLLDIPMHKLERVYVFGNIDITTPAMHSLMRAEIDLSFFTARGQYVGSLGGRMSKNIPLRVQQYQSVFDDEYRLPMARIFIVSKLKNMVDLLRRYSYNHPEVDFKREIETIKNGIKRLDSAFSNDEILGIEGSCSRAYFQCFALMCRSDMAFPGRQKHPSIDPINAMLSLGYTILGNEIAVLLEATSLDPFLGYLHTVRYGRRSLALDLLEEFRQALIDPFILRLINLKVFNSSDFNDVEDKPLRFNSEAFKQFLTEYEKRMAEKRSIGEEKEISWRMLIQQQVEKLRQAIETKTIYQPHNIVRK